MRAIAPMVALTAVVLLHGLAAGVQAVCPTHYELDMEIDYASQTLSSFVGITLANGTQEPVREISLVLYRLQRVRSVTDSDGNELNFTQTVVGLDDYPVWCCSHCCTSEFAWVMPLIRSWKRAGACCNG